MIKSCNYLKLIKFYGWELSFRDIINKAREKELGALFKTGLYNTLVNYSMTASSFLVNAKKLNILKNFYLIFKTKKVAVATIVTYILIDDSNKLDAPSAFVTLTLFNNINLPLMVIPQLLSVPIQVQ